MKKKILVDANFPTETRVVLLDKNNNIENIEYQSTNKKQVKGNIYLAKIKRVEPSLQAAFVEYANDKSGFLPFDQIHPDYYNIPATDQKTTSQELARPSITSDDINTAKDVSEPPDFMDEDEIDIEAIEKMIDNDEQSDFNVDSEELEIEQNHKNNTSTPEDGGITSKEYKIQEVIQKGQIILVQVTKEERGNKGVSLTTYISLAGKYCVLMPNTGNHNGVSKKISNYDKRKKIRETLNGLLSEKEKQVASVIARTASSGSSTLDIKRDYDYLVKLWNKIREAALNSIAPCFIHQEDGILLKTMRDIFDKTVQEVIVEGKSAYDACKKFASDIAPGSESAIKEYRSNTPIFTKFNIEQQLSRLYQPTVNLPSGGYIVINPTEALTSIDVNSGRFTGERNVEKMAVKINLEAAKEVTRQVKLRDLSGLIVIDFIDMHELRNRKIVEKSIREFFSRDKARIQTSYISNFGLLEISRQRMRPSFLELNASICSHCSGKGVVRADESNAMLILRTVENEIYNDKYDQVNVYAIASSVIYLLNNKREEIVYIEQKYSIKLNFYIDRDATSDSFSIEKIKANGKRKSEQRSEVGPALKDTSKIYQDLDNDSTEFIPENKDSDDNKRSTNKKNKKWERKKKVTPKAVKVQKAENDSSKSDRKEISKSSVEDNIRSKSPHPTTDKVNSNIEELNKENILDSKEGDQKIEVKPKKRGRKKVVTEDKVDIKQKKAEETNMGRKKISRKVVKKK